MVGDIVLSHLDKNFTSVDGSTTHALSDVTLEIKPGSFVSLIGPSGCGKSTLLRLISGLDEQTAGDVLLDGSNISGPGADRGFMFQDHSLFPWMSIYDNVAFGLKARGLYEDQKSQVSELLKMVGLEEFENAYPHQLSGGMCQRASLARALAGKPKVLLLDEPLGALDAFTRMNIQDELQRIWQEEKMTMVMVTHDVDEAVYLSDTVVVMTSRPGRVIRTIPIELSRPRDPSSEDFFHYTSLILKTLHFGGNQPEPEYYL